jgi:hypothetical protein
MKIITRDGLWADVCVDLRSGRFVHVVAESFGVAAYVGAEAQPALWRQPVPIDLLRFLRCASAPDGSVRAIGQGGDGRAWLVGPGLAEPLAMTHGVNPVAIRHDGRTWILYIVVRPDAYQRRAGDAVDEVSMPASSQGLRDVLPDGTVVFGEATNTGTFDGYAFGDYQRRDGIIAGRHGASIGVMIEERRHFFRARQGQANLGVHVARSAERIAVCALTESGAWFAEMVPPFPAHEPPAAAPAPSPVPSPAPAPQPDRPAVTITRYEPMGGDAPLTVVASAAVTSGVVETLTWRWRKSGETAWQAAEPVPVAATEHRFTFAEPGRYEIGLRGDGPGGSAETGLRREVRVTPKPSAPVEPAPDVGTPAGPARPGGVTLRTHAARFLGVDLGSPAAPVTADRTAAGEWETFGVERLGGDRVRLKAANGRYVTAEGGGGRELVANRETPAGAWEELKIHTADAGGIAIQVHGGQFVRAHADGSVRADADAIGPDETFTASTPLLVAHGRAALAGPLRVEGRSFMNDAGIFRPIFTSALSVLRRPDPELRAFLDWAASTGFNGVRTFAGALTWAGQSAAAARERLPTLLSEAGARGLYVEVTAITDSEAGGYDPGEHFRAVARICERVDNALLEIANEPYHNTQADRVHEAEFLAALGRGARVPYAFGAAKSDESLEMAGGTYVTAHLDRSRDKWNQVRRVRELEMLSDSSDKPVINNEPIGAAEAAAAGRRESDPAFFFCMGVLNRIFEVGGVFHSDAGLEGVRPGAGQQACAEAFVEGSRLVPVPERLVFKNAGWADSPVAGADFEETIVRAYSGVAGSRAWTTLVGVSGDPGLRLQHGWRIASQLAARPGVTVLELAR